MDHEGFPVKIYSWSYWCWILRHICCSAPVAGPDIRESHGSFVKEATPPICKKHFTLLYMFMVSLTRASCTPACFPLSACSHLTPPLYWSQHFSIWPQPCKEAEGLMPAHTLRATEILLIIKSSKLYLSSQIIYFSGLINGIGCYSVW